MKKLLVLALMALSVAVFAADENTSSDSATGTTTSAEATTTTSVGGAAPVSVGESSWEHSEWDHHLQLELHLQTQ